VGFDYRGSMTDGSMLAAIWVIFCMSWIQHEFAVQDAFFDQQIYDVVCRTIHINSWQLHGSSTKMADWTSQSRSSNPGKSQTKSLDKDQRYEVPSFLRAVPISRFPESRWDVHQPNSWYVHPSFTIRSSSTPCSPVSFSVPEKKKKTHIPAINPRPETSHRTTSTPKTHLGWHVGHHVLRLLHHLGREHGAVSSPLRAAPLMAPGG